MAKRDLQTLVAQLDEAGFFNYAHPSFVDEAKAELIREGLLFGPDSCWELTGRAFAADAERLADGGVLSFLFEISPFLQSQGLRSMFYLDQDFQVGRFAYSVKVNLDEYPMLAAEEYAEVMAWVAVPARAFALINRLLEKRDSQERICTNMNSVAQSSIAIFLTPELYEMLRHSPLIAEDDKLLTVEELMTLY